MELLPNLYFKDAIDWKDVRNMDIGLDDDDVLEETPQDVIDMLGFDPLGIEKHLPGKHDQKTHGRRGAAAVPTYDENGVISGGPVNTVKAVLNNPDLLKATFTQEPRTQGDVLLHTMCTETGFAGKPKVVSKKDLDKHISAGGEELYRGVDGKNHMQHVADFKHGELYIGEGMHGNGIYTAYGKDAHRTALGYAANPQAVMRMSLEKDAKIISLDDLKDRRKRDSDAMDSVMDRSERRDATGALVNRSEMRELVLRYSTLQRINNDEGRYAVVKGYDAIRVAAHGHMVVLNRSKVLVEE